MSKIYNLKSFQSVKKKKIRFLSEEKNKAQQRGQAREHHESKEKKDDVFSHTMDMYIYNVDTETSSITY